MLDDAAGGDNKLSRCIWAAGYAMTDTGAHLQPVSPITFCIRRCITAGPDLPLQAALMDVGGLTHLVSATATTRYSKAGCCAVQAIPISAATCCRATPSTGGRHCGCEGMPPGWPDYY